MKRSITANTPNRVDLAGPVEVYRTLPVLTINQIALKIVTVMLLFVVMGRAKQALDRNKEPCNSIRIILSPC